MMIRSTERICRTLELTCVIFLMLLDSIGSTDHMHPKVLLVSYDGFRWDYLKKIKNPVNFNRVIAGGVHATKGLKNAFITKTLPNHYTLVTGLYEESHGLIANEMYDPVLNESFSLENPEDVIKSEWFDNGGEPIWVTNQKQSTFSSPRRSGSMFWPGSMASVHGFLPTKYFPFNPLMKLEERIDIIISWFLDKDPINLGLLYYEHPDHEGHQFGPESEKMTHILEYLNNATGYLLDSLEKNNLLNKVNLILTSDHGMSSTPKNKVIVLEDHVDRDLFEVIVMNNPVVHIRQTNKTIQDSILSKLQKVPHLKAYKKSEIPREYHYTENRRILDILVVAEIGYSIVETKADKVNYATKGQHGYNNSLLEMHPYFMAMGPAFKINHSVETFNNVDIYPLICKILGIEPAPNNGSLKNVQDLLQESHDKKDLLVPDNTFVVYLVLIIIVGIFGGIFTIGACRQQRYHKLRELQALPFKSRGSYTQAALTKNGPMLPLLSSDSENEF
ncbi:ectonucleotide pyrophosphatase/phosphodiesterase family member 5-like [Saccostrea echinata]|uniref:ectonucleotide pyrophosphatase/phosphodiesterase family member 5-like n=1 Tax=Saccostrea echinata TaxID=191078 RepID=UPI002A8270E8|nr:ectonucleotide pyrophosphatase/phosphodiesterase family member 5-like [Saccostrea echinata]